MLIKKNARRTFNVLPAILMIVAFPVITLSGCQQRSHVKVKVTATVSSDGKKIYRIICSGIQMSRFIGGDE